MYLRGGGVELVIILMNLLIHMQPILYLINEVVYPAGGCCGAEGCGERNAVN